MTTMVKITTIRLSAQQREVLERLRRQGGYRSWAEVVRALLQEAARQQGVEGDEAEQG